MYVERRDFFEMLGVNENATPGEIRTAIARERARGTVDPQTLARVEETLLDPHARIRYGMQRAIARVRREIGAFMWGDRAR